MRELNRLFSKNKGLLYWLGAIIVLYPICFGLFFFSEEAQIPTISTSSGIVAIISAIIGVLLTAFAISIQLKQQSDAETKKDKDVKIHEQKIRVYSEFTSKIWKMADDVDIDSKELSKKYEELKIMCFDKLVFFLKQDEVEQLTKVIEKIDIKKLSDNNIPHLSEITNILQNSLENKYESASYLTNLYKAFDKEPKEITEQTVSLISNNNDPSNITFWHFNMLGEEQIEAFKRGHWWLSLIEYGEDWRTNSLRQVKSGDVVFLFRRGGYGYIGAFKATENKILESETYKNVYSEEDIEKYDMYKSLADGAALASNILVEPLSYNFKGVGYYSVRRYTIQRMNDMEAVKFLLNRFNGKELTAEQTSGIGKLDENMIVKITDENKKYLNTITQKYL
jgi:hypothetical protein